MEEAEESVQDISDGEGDTPQLSSQHRASAGDSRARSSAGASSKKQRLEVSELLSQMIEDNKRKDQAAESKVNYCLLVTLTFVYEYMSASY